MGLGSMYEDLSLRIAMHPKDEQLLGRASCPVNFGAAWEE